MEKVLQNKITEALILIESIDAMATKFNFRNEQWFIDYEDRLNAYSVKDPND